MSRQSRIKLEDPRDGHYHIISRTIQGQYLLNREEKDYFLAKLKKLSRVYFIKVSTYTIMTNHVHLIVQMIPSIEISDEELRRRFEIYYNENKPRKQQRDFDPIEGQKCRRRWSDVSRFVQDLLQRFSRWYNRKYNGFGHVWSDRFKSVLLQSHRALMACMIYVELNSVRAEIAKQPEDYPYCGLSQMLQGGRKSLWFDIEAIKNVLRVWGEDISGDRKVLQRYLEMVHEAGAGVIGGGDTAQKQSLSFRQKIRHFSEGLVLGDQTFCEEKYQEFQSYFTSQKMKEGFPLLGDQAGPNETSLFQGLYSLKKCRNG